MSQSYSRFLTESASKSFDLHHRDLMTRHVSGYDEDVSVAREQFSNLELAKKRAGHLRYLVLEHLEEHLKTFEQHFTNNGGRVIWAETASDARKAILALLQKNEAQTVVRSRSLLTEEIGLTDYLGKNGITCLDTGLGSHLLQITGDEPSHVTSPAMHLTTSDVAASLHAKLGLHENASPAEITAFVRKSLRKKLMQADAAITGADFLLADTGSVAISENEGNAMVAMATAKLHLVVAGIDKLLGSVYDLDLFWPLLATYGNGQQLYTYNALVSGPRIRDERDGPEQMVVVLVDNGRSRLLGTIPQRRSLACIDCGACANVCPVFRTIGGHAYGSVYKGPIGAVVTPHLTGRFEEYKHLSFASTLCGQCSEVCPVGIDLHHQLLMNRRFGVKKGYTSRAERWAMWAYKVGMKKRKRLDRFSPRRKNKLFKRFFAKGWGERRERPMAVKSFASRYK